MVIAATVAVLVLWATYLDVPFELPAETLATDIPLQEPLEQAGTLGQPVEDSRPADNVERCRPSEASRSLVPSKQELEEMESSAVSILRASNDPESLLAAAALSRWRDPPMALELLDQSMRHSSVVPLSAWTAFIICGQRTTLSCDFEKLEEDAIKADNRNGAMWVQVAASRIDSGRLDGAVEAMRQAIAAPDYDSFYSEQVLLIDRALASTTNLSHIERVFRAGMYSSVSPMSFRSLRAQCESEKTGVWPELCEQLGDRMSSDADDIMNQALGMELQELALQNIGDEAGLRELKRSKDSLVMPFGTVETATPLMSLLANDASVLSNYMTNLEIYGEVEAWQRLSEEAERLKGLSEYDQCNFEGDPYLFENKG